MSTPAHSSPDLSTVYRRYIQAIRDRDLDEVSKYVSEGVVHNGKQLGLEGYKDLLKRNIFEPDTQITIKRLIASEYHAAALLVFTTKPTTKELVGIELDGTEFSYAENVFYDFKNGKIFEVHSLVDIDAVRSHARQP